MEMLAAYMPYTRLCASAFQHTSQPRSGALKWWRCGIFWFGKLFFNVICSKLAYFQRSSRFLLSPTAVVLNVSIQSQLFQKPNYYRLTSKRYYRLPLQTENPFGSKTIPQFQRPTTLVFWYCSPKSALEYYCTSKHITRVFFWVAWLAWRIRFPHHSMISRDTLHP